MRGATARLGLLSWVVAVAACAPKPGDNLAGQALTAPEVAREECPEGTRLDGQRCIEKSAPASIPGSSSSVGTWVRIPGGGFRSGDTDHALKTFELQKTEVTVAQYRACVEAGECTAPGSDGDHDNWGKPARDDHPVNTVNWFQASAYCKWAGGRLPTQWEWEWAARGRDEGRTHPWGSAAPSCTLAVANSDHLGCGKDGTWPVGSKPKGASRDGLHDMAGNVWEWTNRGDDSEQGFRVLKGGGWFPGDGADSRADSRWFDVPSSSADSVGFRCARNAN